MTDQKTTEIYLDHNATTPVLPMAAQAVMKAMQELYGNPSSSHITGLRAKQILERTRRIAKQVLGASQGEIIFNSGATEAIHTAIFSALNHLRQQDSKSKFVVLYGATEHKAVPEAIKHWLKILDLKFECLSIPVDAKGQLNLEFIRSFGDRLGLVCTMAVNNETGVKQDLQALEQAIRSVAPKALWLVDSVQALGKMKLNLDELSVDYATFSGHKLYCPKGVGFLYVRQGAPFSALITGGGQESGRRSGTENIPGIASLAEILSLLVDGTQNVFQNEATLHEFNQKIVQTLKDSFPEIVFNTPFDHAVPTTINFSVKGFASKEIMDLFDAAQIRVSSGSACSSKATSSYVLDAMGVESWRSESAIRLSFGPVSQVFEIDEACKRIRAAAKSLQHSCLLINTSTEELEKTKLDGLIQIKNGDASTQIYCSQASKSCVIIDPAIQICERIEHFVSCQNFQVLAILETRQPEASQSCRLILKDLLKDRLQQSAEVVLDDFGAPQSRLLTIDGDTKLRVLAFESQGQAERAYVIEGRNSSRPFVFVHDVYPFWDGLIVSQQCASSEDLALLKLLHQTVDEKTVISCSIDRNQQFGVNFEMLFRARPDLKLQVNAAQNEATNEALPQRPSTATIVAKPFACGSVTESLEAGTINYSSDQVQALIAKSESVLFYDVREPYEFELFHDWKSFGFLKDPINLPLSRFTGVIQSLIAQQPKNQKIIFICRSGARSQQAAKILRQFGFSDVGHITGGVALGLN